MDTSIYISHKRKDFKGFIGILIKSWLTLPIFFCKFSRKAFFEFNKELKTFMVKNTFKEKCPLYFTAMTRHSIVIEQYMEP